MAPTPPSTGNQLNHFLKNLAIIGGLLYFASFGASALSLEWRLVRRSSASRGAYSRGTVSTNDARSESFANARARFA